jgi:hypothetical protein
MRQLFPCRCASAASPTRSAMPHGALQAPVTCPPSFTFAVDVETPAMFSRNVRKPPFKLIAQRL